MAHPSARKFDQEGSSDGGAVVESSISFLHSIAAASPNLHGGNGASFASIDLNARPQLDQHAKARRAAPRYGISYRVLVVTAFQSFRTKTKNISATGMLLEDCLPEVFMKEHFDIVLVVEDDSPPTGKPKSRKTLSFRGKAVGGPLRSSRIHFSAAPLESQQALAQITKDLTPLMVG